jgi:diguanylate cyclase (GGDEF)-like protein
MKGARTRHRYAGESGVWLLSGGLAVVAALLAVVFRDWETVIPGTGLSWWMLIPVFVLVEVFVVHVDAQREAQTISLSEVAVVVGLFLVNPAGLIAAHIVGAGIALTVYRRQPAIKVVFNMMQFGVVTGVAIGLFHLLIAPFEPTGPVGWLIAAVALLCADLVAVSLLTLVTRIVDGSGGTPTVRYFIGFGTLCTLANTALGLLGVEILRVDQVAGLLLAVPIAVTVAAYRGYWREHHRNETLEFLYESMRRLGFAIDLERGIADFLEDARASFRAEIASVVLHPIAEGDVPRRSTQDGERVESLVELRPDAVRGGNGFEPLLAPRRTSGRFYHCRLLGRDVRDAMVIALDGEGGVIGTLVIANRAGSINTFTKSDLKFLRTFAAHAGVVLDNRNLARSLGELSRENDELSHKALHDPLTQLANRDLFLDRTAQALSRRDDGSLVGVLFIDLDDFKLVNDTLGHAAGDRVLVAVAERLRACLRPGDTAARFGGDEFAVLLTDLAHPGEADAICERILFALRAPVATSDQEVRVRASVGVSVHRPGASAGELLDQADEAMYSAKRSGKGRWVAHVAEGGQDD